MDQISVSPRWSFRNSLKTTIRHTVLPLVAGSAVAALQTAQSGTLDVNAMKGAAITAGIAGIIRLFHVFATEHKSVSQ